MAITSQRAGALLVGFLLTIPAGSNGTGERIVPPKIDHATIGTTPQVLTPRELQKMEAARLATTVVPLDAKSSDPPQLSEKPASFGTAGPPAALSQGPVQEKPIRPSPSALATTRVGPKPPERSTCEPAPPGLSAAETAKIEAQRRRRADTKDAGRSER